MIVHTVSPARFNVRKKMPVNPDATPEKTENQFGTFGGVFTPSILTIFGLIMFMRANQVIGAAGILPTFFILSLSSGITFLTGLSIAGISSNTPVKGGGAYFLISRVLGPAFGTAIGIALYLAQAISVPFYILGFVEALTQTFPSLAPYYFWICLAVLCMLFGLVWTGAGWVIKLQYAILAVLLSSIAVFLLGAVRQFEPAHFHSNLFASYPEGRNLWSMFALYFPAVTGIMAGVNMSGDLKDPAKSIPAGTLLAVGVGFLVYALQIFLCGGMASREELIQTPYLLLVSNALFGMGWLVTAGVFLATISSAIGSDLGAPRVLQALARDRVLRVTNPFAKGTVKGDEPRRALVLTFLIGIGTVLIFGRGGGGGGLNIVASVVSMIFLYTYGMTNLAAFVEHFSLNPSFRPRFRFFHWGTALIGGLACIWVAFMISAGAALITLLFIGGVFAAVRKRKLTEAFGDAGRGFVYTSLSRSLKRLAAMPAHPKNWRPTILVFSGNPHARGPLVQLAKWLGLRSGIISLLNIVQGEKETMARERDKMAEQLEAFRDSEAPGIFTEVVIVENFDRDLNIILQSYSIGPIKPNLVLFGWPRGTRRIELYFDHLRTVIDLGKSLLVYIPGQTVKRREKKRIDIYWRGQANGSLMLILGHLLVLNPEWADARLRLLREVETGKEAPPAKAEILAMLREARIKADIMVLVSNDPFPKLLRDNSSDADMVILGLNRIAENVQNAYFANMEKQLEGMPPTLLVYSTGEADLLC
ncbi:MAG: amino acid permease [Lentisphaeria bacterium]|nr:amino acid permease [Lentisphaeria bacterium]